MIREKKSYMNGLKSRLDCAFPQPRSDFSYLINIMFFLNNLIDAILTYERNLKNDNFAFFFVWEKIDVKLLGEKMIIL